ncbi:MAG: hypothetical protein ACLFT5_08650, partial [Desulfovermiculus sp.]
VLNLTYIGHGVILAWTYENCGHDRESRGKEQRREKIKKRMSFAKRAECMTRAAKRARKGA